MSSPLDTPFRLSTISHQAVPGSLNPFLTPSTGNSPARDPPPHRIAFPRIDHQLDPADRLNRNAYARNAFDEAYSYLLSSEADDNDDKSSTTTTTSSGQSTPTPTRQSARHPLLWPTQPDKPIKEKTMTGVPVWPADLRLSLNENNWLEWSRHLITALEMGQLDVYPLGLLKRPDQATDKASHENWRGNDRMILGYMKSHMYPSESQYVATCLTSAEAFSILRQRHEKRSGLTIIQIIQRMIQIRFDPNVNDTDSILVTV